MTLDDFNAPLSSKVNGSWNLHSQLPQSLSFFILFSSVAGIFGSGGQANYATGNTYQDALAHYRLECGQPAISIDLGMMLMDGYLAQNPATLEKFVKPNGLIPLGETMLFALLEYYCNPDLKLSHEQAQVITGLGTAADLRAKGMPEPWWMGQPMFRSLRQASREDQSPSNDQEYLKQHSVRLSEGLKTTKCKPQRVELVVKALLERLHRVMPDVVDLDATRAEQTIKTPMYMLGVDSLVAIELKNFLSLEAAADVATFEILGESSIKQLATLVVEKSKIIAQ